MKAAYNRHTPGIPKVETLWKNENASRLNGCEIHESACAAYIFAGQGLFSLYSWADNSNNFPAKAFRLFCFSAVDNRQSSIVCFAFLMAFNR